jgi:isoleucyl-tRNA synthetase
VRQPLGVLYAVIPGGIEVGGDLLEILRDELNVKRVEFMHEAEELVTFSARPNFKVLGASFGKRTPRVADAIRALGSTELAAFRRGEALVVEVDGEREALLGEELEIVQEARGEMVVESEGGFTVALDATLTPELRAEGLARELVNRVQRLRKDAGFEVADRIRLGVSGGDELIGAVRTFVEMLSADTLAVELDLGSEALVRDRYETIREVDLDGVPATVGAGRVVRGGSGG